MLSLPSGLAMTVLPPGISFGDRRSRSTRGASRRGFRGKHIEEALRRQAIWPGRAAVEFQKHSSMDRSLQGASMSIRSFAVLLLAVFFASCASAPPAAPPSATAATPKAETPRTVELLCGEGARYVTFDKLGVPSQEYPTDVALT